MINKKIIIGLLIAAFLQSAVAQSPIPPLSCTYMWRNDGMRTSVDVTVVGATLTAKRSDSETSWTQVFPSSETSGLVFQPPVFNSSMISFCYLGLRGNVELYKRCTEIDRRTGEIEFVLYGDSSRKVAATGTCSSTPTNKF